MKKLNLLEYLIATVLIIFGLYMMLNGYKQVSFHMEQGKNQPFITNFKHADKVIASKILTAKLTIDTQSLPVDQTMFEIEKDDWS
jgi:predicted tellurium resistance membrane protein TerC